MRQPNKWDINKAYVSPYDYFLFSFDAKHKPSASQLAEIAKHRRIATLRDHAKTTGEEAVIWDEF